MPDTNTRRHILSFALAGIAYFIIAHLCLQYATYLSLKLINAPTRLTTYGYSTYCADIEVYARSHSLWNVAWIYRGWMFVTALMVLAGFMMYRLIHHNPAKRSAAEWLSILLMATPLYYSSESIGIVFFNLLRGNTWLSAHSSYRTETLITWSVLLVISITAGLLIYLRIFNKGERKYLWLVSLPALVLTFLCWFFVVAPML